MRDQHFFFSSLRAVFFWDPLVVYGVFVAWECYRLFLFPPLHIGLRVCVYTTWTGGGCAHAACPVPLFLSCSLSPFFSLSPRWRPTRAPGSSSSSGGGRRHVSPVLASRWPRPGGQPARACSPRRRCRRRRPFECGRGAARRALLGGEKITGRSAGAPPCACSGAGAPPPAATRSRVAPCGGRAAPTRAPPPRAVERVRGTEAGKGDRTPPAVAPPPPPAAGGASGGPAARAARVRPRPHTRLAGSRGQGGRGCRRGRCRNPPTPTDHAGRRSARLQSRPLLPWRAVTTAAAGAANGRGDGRRRLPWRRRGGGRRLPPLCPSCPCCCGRVAPPRVTPTAGRI